MEREQFSQLVSSVQKWIVYTLAEHEEQMEPIAAAQFERLERYYPNTLLHLIQRVIVDRCPIPPPAITEIPQLVEIENWDIKGIPWKNTIFIRRDLADWDAIHFHELLHIIQWEYLGTESYLTAWTIGTITRGYRDNPLEEAAFRHQLRFETEHKPYDTVREVIAEISQWPDNMFDLKKIAYQRPRVGGQFDSNYQH